MVSHVDKDQSSLLFRSYWKNLECGTSLVAVHNKDLMADRASGSTVSRMLSFNWRLCRMHLTFLKIVSLNRSLCASPGGLYGVVRECATPLFARKVSNSADKDWFSMSLWKNGGVPSTEKKFRREDKFSVEVILSITNAKGNWLCSSINQFAFVYAEVFGPTRSIDNLSNGRIARTTADGNFGLKKFGLISLHVRHSEIVDLISSSENA